MQDPLRELGEALGYSGRALEVFVHGHDPGIGDGFDGLTNAFVGMGLSAEDARVAAIGHDGSEAEARAAWEAPTVDASGPLDDASRVAFVDAFEGLVHAMITYQGYGHDEAVRFAGREADQAVARCQHVGSAAARAREATQYVHQLALAMATPGPSRSGASESRARRRPASGRPMSVREWS